MKSTTGFLAAGALLLFYGAVAFSSEASVEHGKQVYAEQKCGMCHSIGGKGGKISPLDGVGSKLTAEEIRKWIVSPKEMKPNIAMKSYADLPPKDIDALVAYLQTLK